VPRPLRAHLDALARAHRTFLDAVDALPADVRERRPSPEAWSPVEILEHLVRTEDATLRAVEHQIAAGDARKDLGPTSRLKTAALLLRLASPMPLRVPERARGIHPERDTPFEALRERFTAFDARWQAVAETLPDALAGVGLMKHPVIGALTAADAARFMTAHVVRHRGQVARAVRAADRAPSPGA